MSFKVKEGIVIDGNTFVDSSRAVSATTVTSNILKIPSAVGTNYLIGDSDTSITGCAYSGKSVSITAKETVITGVFFKSDGLQMFIVGSASDSVHSYTLSTAWDVTTATFVSSFSVSAQDTSPQDLFFKPDGTVMYIAGDAPTDTTYQYQLSTPWDITTATFTAGQSLTVTTQDGAQTGITFTPNGLELYVSGNATDRIHKYTLSTAWDITTATYSNVSLYIGAEESAPHSVQFNAAGTKLYIVGTAVDYIHEYTLSTAWDITTATLTSSLYVGDNCTSPTGLFISENNALYVADSVADRIFQYTFNVGVKLTTSALSIYSPVNIKGSVGISDQISVRGISTFQGASTFIGLMTAGSITSGSTITFNGAAINIVSGATGTVNVGTATTGTATHSYTTGATTAANTLTLNIGTGAAVSTATKNISIGTGGLSGSTTNITIGATVGNGTTNIAVRGSSTFTSNSIPIDVQNSGQAQGILRVITERYDGNNSPTFTGTIALARDRTDTLPTDGQTLSRVIFGSTITPNDKTTDRYSSSIVAYADGAVTSTVVSSGLRFYVGTNTTNPRDASPIAQAGDILGLQISKTGAVLAPASLTISGDLTANGTTTTLNSTTVTIGANNTSTMSINSVVKYNATDGSANATAAGVMDLNLGDTWTQTASGVTTLSFTNVPAAGRAKYVVLELTNGGPANSIVWPTGTKWPSGTAPTLTNPGVDIIVFFTDDGGTTWRASIAQKDSR